MTATRWPAGLALPVEPTYFRNRADAMAATLPPGTTTFELRGYNTPGDRGGGTYVKMATPPSFYRGYQLLNAASGDAYQLDADEICPEQAGAVSGVMTGTTQEIQDKRAANYVALANCTEWARDNNKIIKGRPVLYETYHATGANVINLINCHLRGSALGPTKIHCYTNTAAYVSPIAIGGLDCTIEKVTFELKTVYESALNVFPSQPIVTLTGATSGLNITKCRFRGTDTVRTDSGGFTYARTHAILIGENTAGTISVDGMKIMDCDFNTLAYGIFTNNDQADIVQDVQISGNRFRNFYAEAICMNSFYNPAVAAGYTQTKRVWRRVIVTENRFLTRVAALTPTGLWSMCVGVDNGSEILMANNTVQDWYIEGMSPFHVENRCDNVTISGNTAINVWGLATVYSQSQNVSITSNKALRDEARREVTTLAGVPATNTNFNQASKGIFHVFEAFGVNPDGGGTANDILISDNILDGFDYGMTLGQHVSTMRVRDNVIKRCGTAVHCAGTLDEDAFAGNTITLCPVVLGGTGPRALSLGRNDWVGNGNWLASGLTARVNIRDGMTFTTREAGINATNAAAVNMDIMQVPSAMNGTISIDVEATLEGISDHIRRIVTLVITSGAITTQTVTGGGVVGTIAGDNGGTTPLSIVSGRLVYPFYNSGATPRNAIMNAKMTGSLVIN